MNPELTNWLNLLFRWAHVVAGITWIGHLYFFNWVNGPFQKTLDGATKKAIVPELMPRALFWFRWGAAWTWISGLLLAGLIYYHGRITFEDPSSGNPWLWLAIFLAILIVGFLIYNAVMNAVKNVIVANVINLLVFAGAYCLLECVGHYSGRSLYIHAGAMLGTVMAGNVWMVIWPAQKKIIQAVKDGTAPDADLVAKAGLRSRQNTFMSVPLVFLMISNHYPTVYGAEGVWCRDLILVGIMAVGFIATRLLYNKSAKVTGF